VFRAALTALLIVAATVAAGAEPPLRDPMQPFRAVGTPGDPSGEPAPRFRLTAVLISSERRVAIVNGKSYLPGALVDGAEIVDIEPRSIRLRDGDTELIVHLGSSRNPAPVAEGESGQ
jgi:hypothetical protein